MKELRLIRHGTPIDVVCAYFGVDEAAFRESGVCGMTGDGGEIDLSPGAMLDAITEQGLWGFADKEGAAVHVWVDGGADDETVIGFLAHEIGHNTGDHDCDDLAEERRADSFRHVAERAFRWLRELRPVETEERTDE